MEFQGAVLYWLQDEIRRRPGLPFDKVTQEKPRVVSGKRSDLIVWRRRELEHAFLTIELKTPDTPINEPSFLVDAIEKAQFWQAPYFAIWNMKNAELYKTPSPGQHLTPSDNVQTWTTNVNLESLEHWLKPKSSKILQAQALEILDQAWSHDATSGNLGATLDSEIFVERLSSAASKLRALIYEGLTAKAKVSERTRLALKNIAITQGFIDFVEDVPFAIAGQMAYRLIGQILFYFALRRRVPQLPELDLIPNAPIPFALRHFWNEVRRYDYEALYRPEPIETLVELPELAQRIVRNLIQAFSAYDWASLTDDILGSTFERLVPLREQMLLGQFYTPRSVADLLVAMTVDGERPLILDPACGSGTFLMSAYSFTRDRARLTHKEALAKVWGFDLSPFATELALINLYRQDLSQFENFPRVVTADFFEKQVGENIAFPPARLVAGPPTKNDVPIPIFDSIIGNPPYLRSQNQDDLDLDYRARLFSSAAAVGVSASAKTDLFAFFFYHAIKFMRVGTRIGFVTPASWLSADYAMPLQKLLLGRLRLRAIVASEAETFFPQVAVNAVLVIAEYLAEDDDSETECRFVTLKQRIGELAIPGNETYWDDLVALSDQIISSCDSADTAAFRATVRTNRAELVRLGAQASALNWSQILRAPTSYKEIFGLP